MINKARKTKSWEIWEHLEHTLKHTSYAQRLQWLEQADHFMRTLRRNKNYPNLSRKS